MEDKFKCPRCGFEQPETAVCSKCRVNIPRYIEIKKTRSAVPGDYVRKPRARDDKQPAEGPPPEKRHDPSQKAGQAQKEDSVPPEIPEIEIHREESGTEGGLTGIGTLFEKTWDIFKRRVGTLILLYIISIALFLIPVGIFCLCAYLISLALPGSFEPLMVVGIVLGATAGFIAGIWGLGSLISAVADENLTIKDALEKGGQNIWAFTWLFMLLGHIVTGGFLLFFVPGVIFLVWFMFSQFILPNEGERGMNAILKSKEYVRGHWVDVFARLFIIWLVSAGVGMIPFIGIILSILVVPFEMIFIYLIYEDLRSVKGDVSYPSSSGEKFKWIAISTLGFIVLPLIIIALIGATLMSSLLHLKETFPF